MAFHGYVSFKGTKQGQLKAETKGSRSWKSKVLLEFQWGVQSPLDSNAGKPKGPRTHDPITITREVDEASPLLWAALCTNEALESVKFTFDKAGSGSPGPKFTRPRFRSIELRNALISGILQAPRAGGRRREKLTLNFEELFINGNPQLVMLHYS
jgi:type VI secretion system secreted protein Hcp